MKVKEKDWQTLFQVGIRLPLRANECDYSSAASAVSAVESAPEVGSTNDDDKNGTNQPSRLNQTPFQLSHKLKVCYQLRTLLMSVILVCGKT